MSTARPTGEESTAATLADTRFVRVVAASDGDSLAAAGILARACDALGVPFQVRVGRDVDPVDDGVTVAVGPVGSATAAADSVVDASDATVDRPASPTAFAVARELGADPDPVLTLAGTVAAGESPTAADDAYQVAEGADRVRQRPGVAVPTDDLADGLAASTRLVAPFSGDVESARALLGELDAGTDTAEFDAATHRRLASLVAIEAAGAEGATPRAAEQVETALRPHETPDAPFATLGGYADVLDAVARERPGVGVALALGRSDRREAALSAWRTHAAAVHRLLRGADVARHRGLSVAAVGDGDPGALPTVARLFRDFRAPEDVALVVADGAAAAASVNPTGVGDAMAAAADAVDGTGSGTETTGTARFDTETEQFTDAFREAL